MSALVITFLDWARADELKKAGTAAKASLRHLHQACGCLRFQGNQPGKPNKLAATVAGTTILVPQWGCTASWRSPAVRRFSASRAARVTISTWAGPRSSKNLRTKETPDMRRLWYFSASTCRVACSRLWLRRVKPRGKSV